jgi:hypothetical protein
MKCVFCNAALVGFADAQVVYIGRGEKAVACMDLDACRERRDAGQRASRDRAPAPVIEMPRRGGAA